ncbi:MAG TPA: class I SAM-dependent methyltransferase [bacterium]|nr:class I SAM-dependent methyltransferase [bacterium]
MDSWYKGMYGEHYYRASFAAMPAERTQKEVEFIRTVLNLPPGARVLDLCCGPGRHTLALAQLGYRMSGLDLSEHYIKLARNHAKRENLDVDFQIGDMRRIPFRSKFDAVINIFTSFGYFDSDEENASVIQGVVGKLKPGGKFLLDVINRDYIVRNMTQSHWLDRGDILVLQDHSFDPVTSRTEDRWVFLEKKSRKEFDVSIRLYALHEIIALFQRAGLTYQKAWGNFAGEPFDYTSQRIIALGVKPQ